MSDKHDCFAVSCDFSGAGKMTIPALKKFISQIASFGYNTFFFSSSGLFEVKEEPYLGYLQGKYTEEEIKDLDQYCLSLGIEMIPDIQSLGHMPLFKWPHYWDIRDIDDILLVGDKKTEEFLDHLFAALRRCFSSHRIHLGLDEAHNLGRGRYHDLHGDVPQSKIFFDQVQFLKKLCKKYSFSPLMWSDMLYKSCNHGVYYDDKFHFSEAQKKYLPKGVTYIYWDYYSTSEPHYEAMMKSHLEVNKDVWFATSACTFEGFAPLNSWTLKTAIPGLDAAKKCKIRNIIVTLWGDDNYECSYNAALPALYAISEYWKGNKDLSHLQEGFKEKTGENYDHLFALEKNNLVKQYPVINNNNPAKWMFYADPFLGYTDQSVKEGCKKNFEALSKEYASYEKGSSYCYLFALASALSSYLAYKAELGVKTRKAYQAHNKKALRALILDYQSAEKKLKNFYACFKTYWEKENKEMGLEEHQLRIGATLFRLKECEKELQEYVDGKRKEIPALEAKLLDYFGKGDKFDKKECPTANNTQAIQSVYH